MINSTLRNNLLSLITAKSKSLTGSGECWLGLLLTAPTNENGTGYTEPSGASYERIQLNINAAMQYTDKWGTVSGGVVTNIDEICSSECKEDAGWGTEDAPITHFGIFGAKTGGAALAWDKLRDITGQVDENGLYPITTLTVAKNEVAVFRKETLMLKLI